MTKIPEPRADEFRDPSARWVVFSAAALIAVAVLAAYWTTFRVPLLLDDMSTIGSNPSIQHLANLRKVLASDNAYTESRPLLNLTFAINYAVSGQEVWSYHAVNFAVHVFAALLLFGVVRCTLLSANPGERARAAALPLGASIAAVWALHPLQTEAVTYLSQRAESLMGLFYLLTLYGFIRSTTSPRPALWRAGSILACLCGMATKEVMVTAPLIVLLYDGAFVAGSLREAWTIRRRYYLGLAASWVLLGCLIKGGGLQHQAVGFHAGVSATTYALTELKVVTEYLKLAVWPHPLVFDYGPEIMVTRVGQWAPFLPVIVALAIAALVAWRRSKAVGFVAVAFFVLLSPTSSFVPVAEQPMAESRMYLPLAAVVALVGAAGYAWLGRAALAGLAIAALGLGALTFSRNKVYHSAIGIWQDTIAKQPASLRGRLHLANTLVQTSGRLDEALAQYQAVLRMKPDFAEAHVNLANALTLIPDRVSEAMGHYEEALRIKPGLAAAHFNLAALLARMPGRLPEAIAHYEDALRINPAFAEAHVGLAAAYTTWFMFDDAIRHYEMALKINPEHFAARNNLRNLRAARP